MFSIHNRIHIWRKRQQLTDEEAEFLNMRLEQERSSAYLVDLSIYLAIKVIVLLFEITALPLLLAFGIIDEVIFGLFFIIDGPILRSIYASYRMIQAAIAGYEIPWIAFFVGLILLEISLTPARSSTHRQVKRQRWLDLLSMIHSQKFQSGGRRYPY